MIKNLEQDIIAAIATPAGTGAISIIRVSGKGAIAEIDKIFSGRKELALCNSHTVHYGKITDGENIIDDVLVSIFKAPNSYTGEESVEISCHGNPLISGLILKLITQLNIRLAEPGEFTKRAFLNNRMDLTQAEAVADVINAHSESSLKGARNQLDGVLSSYIISLKKELTDSASLIELELDFAEEDVEFINKPALIEKLKNLIKEIEYLINSFSYGKIVKEGVNVAITGHTNVGKSSLLNCLLKESRAIVSSIPGTTRDVISADVSINGYYYKLYDTAGIRKSEDVIEKEGIKRTHGVIDLADIIVALIDPTNKESYSLVEEIKALGNNVPVIVAQNKADLMEDDSCNADVKISTVTKKGIDEFMKLMEQKVVEKSIYTESSILVNNIRHQRCLINAKESLEMAIGSLNDGYSGEFVSVDIRNALLSLNEIIGEVSTEDILNNIFAKFCIGK